MREIALVKGTGIALVDDDDYESLSRLRWYLHPHGYAVCRTGDHKTTARMHRVIMQAPVGVQVDHENRNRLDNRRSNLRFATAILNSRNAGATVRSKSGVRGVYWEHGKWLACSYHLGREYRLGRFVSIADAAAAYQSFNEAVIAREAAACSGIEPDPAIELAVMCRPEPRVRKVKEEKVRISRPLRIAGAVGRIPISPRTNCRQGHEFDLANTYLWTNGSSNVRRCRICEAEREKRRPYRDRTGRVQKRSAS